MNMLFPGGDLFRSLATKAELQASAVSWLAMAQSQIGSVSYWMAQGDRSEEAGKALDVLRSQLEHVRRALTEAGHCK